MDENKYNTILNIEDDIAPYALYGYPKVTMSVVGRHIDCEIPLMELEEINFIESILKKNHIVLEWGCGGSSLHFSKFVKKYIGIENSMLWYSLTMIRCLETGIKNLDLHLVRDLHFTNQKEERDFDDYVNILDKLEHKRYDVIIIDGDKNSRNKCAEKALQYSDDDSIIIFHDYFTEKHQHKINGCSEYIKPLEDYNIAILKR